MNLIYPGLNLLKANHSDWPEKKCNLSSKQKQLKPFINYIKRLRQLHVNFA